MYIYIYICHPSLFLAPDLKYTSAAAKKKDTAQPVPIPMEGNQGQNSKLYCLNAICYMIFIFPILNMLYDIIFSIFNMLYPILFWICYILKSICCAMLDLKQFNMLYYILSVQYYILIMQSNIMKYPGCIASLFWLFAWTRVHTDKQGSSEIDWDDY